MQKQRHNIADVKAMARGRWLDIVPALDSRFAGMEGSKGTANNHYPCPVHGGVDGFRFLPDAPETGAGICNTCGSFRDGFELLQWACGWSFPWSLHQVYLHLNGSPVSENRATVGYATGVKPKTDNLARLPGIKKQWSQAKTEPHEPARLYYQRRGLASVPFSKSLRYHPGIPLYVSGQGFLTKEKGGWITWPAILGAMRNSSGSTGLYQIYLTKDGRKATEEIKAEVSLRYGAKAAEKLDCKRFFNHIPLPGSAVRLGSAGRVLGVTEGIETMLAVQQLTGSLSLAACGQTSLLKGVHIPEQVEKLIIFADRDRPVLVNGKWKEAGKDAAEALKARVLAAQENRVNEVVIMMPELDIPDGSKGVDWLDFVESSGSVSLSKQMCLE